MLSNIYLISKERIPRERASEMDLKNKYREKRLEIKKSRG